MYGSDVKTVWLATQLGQTLSCIRARPLYMMMMIALHISKRDLRTWAVRDGP
jgi:hypothetical protein